MKVGFKSQVLEEGVLLGSALKWIFYSSIVGIIVGVVTSVFIKVVELGSNYIQNFKYYYVLIPAALFLSCLIIIKFAPQAKGHGTEKAIETVNKNHGDMDIKVVPVKSITTLITVVFGGSVGLEGPSTQIGAGICSFLGRLFKMAEIDKRRLVVAGISAGFVSVFGAPVGAAVFAAEVLYMGKLSYVSLLPSIIASITSYNVGLYLGKKPLNYVINYTPQLSIVNFLKLIFFGILIGVFAIIFIKVVNNTEKAFEKINIYKPLKGIIGGVFIIALVYIIGSTNYLGIGEEIMNKGASGESLNKFSFIYKMLTTSITLGSGGSGGILTPMLFIGTGIGNSWAQLIGGNISFFSCIGMVAFLGACANTPIASIIISLELFDHKIGMCSAIVCIVSYFIVGHRSIYPTQFIMFSKTPSLDVNTNCQVNRIQQLIINPKNYFIRKIIEKSKTKIGNLNKREDISK